MFMLSRTGLSSGGILKETVKEMLTLFMLAALSLLAINGVWLLWLIEIFGLFTYLLTC